MITGIFIRVQRDNKWQNICIEDMTDLEREEYFDKYKDKAIRFIHVLCDVIKKVEQELNEGSE